MKTNRRRQRRFDPLATTAAVRSVCDQLRNRCPELIPSSDKKLFSLLNAVRHVERYSASDTRAGRPSKWKRKDLLEVARHLRAILERETSGRVSLSSFIGLYIRILQLPADVSSALEKGLINLQEALLLSRLTHQRLDTSGRKAEQIRREILASHLQAQASQNSLRQRVREMLGEASVVSSETLAAAVQTVDELLTVDPADKRHLFYEQIKNLFYAMKEVRPEDIDEKGLSDFSQTADQLFLVIQSMRQRRKQKQKAIEKFYF